MPAIRKEELPEFVRIYIDLPRASSIALKQIAATADIPKKRVLELLIEREVKEQKKRK